MSRAVCCVALLFLASPLWGADSTDPARQKEEPKKEAKLDPNRPIPLGRAVGVIQSVNTSEGTITVEVTFQYLQPNVQAQQNYVREAQQLLVRQQQILRTPNPVQRQQQYQQLLQAAQNLQRQQQNLFQVKEIKQKIDLQLADDVKVRTPQPPVNFDDKGNPKAYTAEELKELRGKEGLPGFTSDKDELRQGQTVLVALVRKRPTLLAKDGEKVKDGEKDTSMPANEKPLATIVVILVEPK